jgi:hypothetical protein
MKYRINPRLLESEPLRRCQLDECHAACCLHGAWVDLVEIKDIRSHANMIAAHMPMGVMDPGGWFDDRIKTAPHAISGQVGHTTVLSAPGHYGGTACIFLRGDHKCALQATAIQAHLHPWRFKPFYCILHPLDLDELGRITLDDTNLMLSEPGSCLRQAQHPIPLIDTFAEELRYLLGEKNYQKLNSSQKI